jgi:SAM-dependent methyltransferase
MDYDAAGIAEAYEQARVLPADTLELWRGVIRRAVPACGHPVVDVGCGTGRFTRLLADLYAVTAIGVEPSRSMLGQRDRGSPGRVHFLAGSGEALPLRTGSADLVFLSMVYHHFRSVPAVLGELRRVLRPGGYLLLRNTTRETLDGLEYLRFFPESRRIEMERMPAWAEIRQMFAGRGFSPVGQQTVLQKLAANHKEYFEKIRLRGLSSLQLIPDEAFQRGLREFERHCRAARPDEAVYEPVDLFVFQVSGGSP